MKGLGALVLTAGLVSAVTINPNVQNSVQASPVVDQASSTGQAESVANIFNSSASLNGSQTNSADPNFDPASLNLGNVGGLNLGQVDFSDQNSVASAILSMLNVLCAGNLFDLNSILSLGANNDLEMFLELVQLMQLEQLGFLNVFDVQSLISSGFSSGFGSGFGGSNSDLFNLGSFKRAVSDSKKTMKRTRLRRTPTKTRTKRQCQAGAVDPNAAANIAPGVAAPEASAAPAVAAPPAASAAPAAAPEAAPAAAAPAAAPAAASADDGESLSDFTR